MTTSTFALGWNLKGVSYGVLTGLLRSIARDIRSGLVHIVIEGVISADARRLWFIC